MKRRRFWKPVFRRPSRFGEWLERARIRARGRADGKRGVPGPNEKTSAVYLSLKQLGDQRADAVAAYWRDTNRELRGEWCALLRRADRLEQQAAELESPVQAAKEWLARRREALERQLKKVESLSGPGRYRIAPDIYWIGLALLFAGDVPLNAVAFRLFREPELLTWVMTFVLALALVVGAHGLGVELRHEIKNKYIMAISVAIPTLLAIVVPILRERYLETEEQTPLGFTGYVVFALVNIAVFLGAVLLSYYAHDPYATSVNDARKEIKKAEKDLAEKQRALDNVRDQLTAVRAQAAEIHAWGEEELQKAQRHAGIYKNHYEHLMMEYRASNQRKRLDQQVIPALEEWSEVVIPDDLSVQLVWECMESDLAEAPPERVTA